VNPVDELVAIEEIRKLKARYCRYVDMHDWESWRELFTEDIKVELDRIGSFEGRDQFVDGMIERRRGIRVCSVHHCHTPEIEILGDTRARGTWAMNDYVDKLDPATGAREARHGYGHYHEEYVREEGWRISSLKLVRLRIDEVPQAALPAFP
jgi:hypothetical protein